MNRVIWFAVLFLVFGSVYGSMPQVSFLRPLAREQYVGKAVPITIELEVDPADPYQPAPGEKYYLQLCRNENLVVQTTPVGAPKEITPPDPGTKQTYTLPCGNDLGGDQVLYALPAGDDYVVQLRSEIDGKPSGSMPKFSPKFIILNNEGSLKVLEPRANADVHYDTPFQLKWEATGPASAVVYEVVFAQALQLPEPVEGEPPPPIQYQYTTVFKPEPQEALEQPLSVRKPPGYSASDCPANKFKIECEWPNITLSADVEGRERETRRLQESGGAPLPVFDEERQYLLRVYLGGKQDAVYRDVPINMKKKVRGYSLASPRAGDYPTWLPTEPQVVEWAPYMLEAGDDQLNVYLGLAGDNRYQRLAGPLAASSLRLLNVDLQPLQLRSDFFYYLMLESTTTEARGFSNPILVDTRPDKGCQPVGGPDDPETPLENESLNQLSVACTGSFFNNGPNFQLTKVTLNWDTCAARHSTALDVEIEYLSAGVAKTTTVTTYNFLPLAGTTSKYLRLLDGETSPHFLQLYIDNFQLDPKNDGDQGKPDPEPWGCTMDLWFTVYNHHNLAADQPVPKWFLAANVRFQARTPSAIFCSAYTEEDRQLTDEERDNILPDPPEPQRAYDSNARLCQRQFNAHSGAEIQSFDVLEAPCGEQQVFKHFHKNVALVAQTGLVETCGGQDYIQVQRTEVGDQIGWTLTDFLERCPLVGDRIAGAPPETGEPSFFTEPVIYGLSIGGGVCCCCICLLVMGTMYYFLVYAAKDRDADGAGSGHAGAGAGGRKRRSRGASLTADPYGGGSRSHHGDRDSRSGKRRSHRFDQQQRPGNEIAMHQVQAGYGQQPTGNGMFMAASGGVVQQGYGAAAGAGAGGFDFVQQGYGMQQPPSSMQPTMQSTFSEFGRAGGPLVQPGYSSGGAPTVQAGYSTSGTQQSIW